MMDIYNMSKEQLIEAVEKDRFFKQACELREQLEASNNSVKYLEERLKITEESMISSNDCLTLTNNQLLEIGNMLQEVHAVYQKHVQERGVPNDVCSGNDHTVNAVFVNVPLLKKISRYLNDNPLN
ncbi:MAG: hypothetical protein AXW14_08630 [Alteromonas sp. Nap_26]|nr:MAG: hypothetical protein AXW14_08630 [Alteromonas sp. Nap_26]